jgi:hypothetical protein
VNCGRQYRVIPFHFDNLLLFPARFSEVIPPKSIANKLLQVHPILLSSSQSHLLKFVIFYSNSLFSLFIHNSCICWKITRTILVFLWFSCLLHWTLAYFTFCRCIHLCIHSILFWQLSTPCAAYASKAQNIFQFVTVCTVYVSTLLPYAQHTLANWPFAKHTLAICYRKRSVR